MLKKKEISNLEQIVSQTKLPKFLSARKQKTLKKSLYFNGIGLHTGNIVSMELKPAPEDTGIIFRKRLNKNNVALIPAHYSNVKSTNLCTLLSDSYGNTVSTVEHILSALYAFEVDNVFIDIDSNEIPVYDGSSKEFSRQLKNAEFDEQHSYKKFIKIKKNVEILYKNKCARVSPFDNTLITTEIEYDHKSIGKQTISLILTQNIYDTQISNARTFGFLNDVKDLRAKGLALGGSLDNAIVLDEKKVLNKEGLRFSDEFVRHKLLDFIGDISLSGHRILGSFFTSHPGHELNYKLLKKVFDSKDNWELVCSN